MPAGDQQDLALRIGRGMEDPTTKRGAQGGLLQDDEVGVHRLRRRRGDPKSIANGRGAPYAELLLVREDLVAQRDEGSPNPTAF